MDLNTMRGLYHISAAKWGEFTWPQTRPLQDLVMEKGPLRGAGGRSPQRPAKVGRAEPLLDFAVSAFKRTHQMG
jgi:hypothetical protein